MKRTDIRWNLVEEFNRMNLVQDERTEQEAEKDRKISLVWTAALLVLLLWPLRDEGTSRGFAVVDLCALALRAVLGCGLYGAYLALAQTHVMNRAKQEDPEGWWPNEHPGRGLAVLLALAAAGLAMMAAGWNFG